MSFDEVPQRKDGPDNGKAFLLRIGVVALDGVEGTTPIIKWLVFTVIISLQKRIAELVCTCIDVER